MSVIENILKKFGSWVAEDKPFLLNISITLLGRDVFTEIDHLPSFLNSYFSLSGFQLWMAHLCKQQLQEG